MSDVADDRPRILLAEDEHGAREALRALLEDEGYEVRHAADGVAALAALRGWSPDLLVTDVKMPALDGHGLMAELGRRLPDVPVIVVSGHGTIEEAVDTLHRGAADYLGKPLDLDRLLASIRRALARSRDPLGLGQVFGGRYRLDAAIGEGAMGRVYRATHLGLGREVALKVFTAHRDVADGRARFLREAQVAASLRHPGVVQILDYGSEGGLPYLVMELLVGHDLREEVDESLPPLAIPRALEIAGAIASVLIAAHRQGLTHRDLKPENVFLERIGDREVVRLLDFGFAFLADDETSGRGRLTADGLIVGTPFYIAPEQVRGQAIGPPADIYALGCLLYEMLCGRTPFTGETFEVMSHHVHAPPPPLQGRRPELPPGLGGLVDAMLDKRPAARPSAEQVASALRRLGADAGAKLPARVIVVGELDDDIVAAIERSGLAIERTVERAIEWIAETLSPESGDVVAILALACGLPTIKALVATGIPVIADLGEGEVTRGVALRRLGVAARLIRPLAPDLVVSTLARLRQRARA